MDMTPTSDERKIILCGDPSVGKTCIVSRYDSGVFPNPSIPTIGGNLKNKIVKMDDTVVKAQIWDTAGQEKYKSMVAQHFKKSVGALLVYDVTNFSSFESIKSWIEQMRENTDKSCQGILVGNKVDLCEENPERRQVETELARDFATQNNLMFIETSALTNLNIDNSFEDLIRKIFQGRKKDPVSHFMKNQKMAQMLLGETPTQQKKCCN